MLNWLFGDAGGASRRDVKKMFEREKLSDFLPYRSYCPTTQTYDLHDGYFGYLWEIQPVPYAGEAIITAVKRLLTMDLPKSAIMQFILFPDPYIDDYLDRYQSLKLRRQEVVQANVKSFVKYWKENQNGVDCMRGIPLRNYRVFIALKSDELIDPDIVSGLKESLNKFGVRHVPDEGRDGLVAILRRMFSKMNSRKSGSVEPSIPLNKQVLDGGLEYSFKGNVAKIGENYARCFTPQAFPKTVSPELLNRLFGGMMGVTDDVRQITAPYMFSVTVFFKENKKELKTKANVTGFQKGGAKFSTELERRTEEYQWISTVLESGEKILKFVPVMWIFGESEEKVRDAVSRAKGIWDDLNFPVQDESYLMKPLFVMSLPFGFYDIGKNLKVLERDFMAPVSTLANLVPVQADYRGAGKPSVLMFGRKGQMVTVDLFDHRINNHNFFVGAESGAGKSFMLNYLLNQYYAQGTKIRIVDLGYSYQKVCSLMGGRFLDLGADGKLCINPFDFRASDDEDRDLGIQTASAALALMVSSASGTSLDEESFNLLRMASRWVVNSGKGGIGVDAAREFLATFPANVTEAYQGSVDFLIQKSQDARI